LRTHRPFRGSTKRKWPAATGEATAADLQRERPKTSQRTVFVRRVPPCDLPITREGVSHVITYTYARAGLPYIRSHLLHHTMASRILEGGSSIREVADVLRHRSLDAALFCAKLESTRLRASLPRFVTASFPAARC
jgi:integrase/recombinase XerC